MVLKKIVETEISMYIDNDVFDRVIEKENKYKDQINEFADTMEGD